MKNIIFKLNKKTSVLLLLIFITISLSKAQTPNCNYQVTNGGACIIDVTVDFIDNSGVCSSQTSTIAASSPLTFSCGTCNQPLQDVKVTVNLINGQPLTSGTGIVNIINTTSSGNINSTGCNGQNTYNLIWTTADTFVGY